MAARAMTTTILAIACLVLREWGFAVGLIAVSVPMWIWAVREELADRRAEETS